MRRGAGCVFAVHVAMRVREREAGSTRLQRAAEREPARMPVGAIECSVRKVQLNKEASAQPANGTTRDMRRARDELSSSAYAEALACALTR